VRLAQTVAAFLGLRFLGSIANDRAIVGPGETLRDHLSGDEHTHNLVGAF